MLFSSLTFLFLFFPTVVILYYLMPSRQLKNGVLLVFSLLFYSWGEPMTIFLMLLVVILTYFITIKMDKEDSKSKARNWLILECTLVLGCLFVFKYYNFFFVRILGIESLAVQLVLPIGISFYSFQILSYVIDVYRKEVTVQKNVFDLCLYVSLFPQLIAGPIVRYKTVAEELKNRVENYGDIASGIRRFIIGLGKKIIISNNMAIVADYVFKSQNLSELSSFMCWLGALSFMFQIYFDFSGYSDMAIGIGKMFGFHFLENFNFPYISKSITEFWRRWHISLSSWFKDYVYIPLGGSRVSKSRWFINILIVWALTGLWHGAATNFVLWGMYYGGLLILEKLFLGKILAKLPGLNWIITMFIVLFGWVLFNAPSAADAMVLIQKMLQGFSGYSFSQLNNLGFVQLWPYYLLAVIGSFPIMKKLINKVSKSFVGLIAIDLYLAAVLMLCIMFLINDSYNPFIYFRF